MVGHTISIFNIRIAHLVGVVFILLACQPMFGQFGDDFSDGDLLNPTWQGDVNHFLVNADNQLQLNAPEAGSSTLYLPTTVPDSAVWEIWTKMDFSPSQSNQLEIYLLAQNADLTTADAIFLQLGENGSDDAIHIIQRLSGTESELAVTAAGSIASSPVELQLKIEKINQQWQLFVDYTGNTSPTLAATWTNNISNSGDTFFGLTCRYTASRVDKFYFDDIQLSQWLPDTQAPNLIFAQAESPQEVTLSFDEIITESSLNNSNFSLSENIGTPADVDFVSGDNSKINLFLSQDLTNGTTYTVTAQNISDNQGNLGNSQIDFTFIVPETIEPFDIIFNEIFPDPKPSVGLPEKEFIELYNQSNKILNIGELTLQVNNTTRTLPDVSMMPDSYLILVDEGDLDLWTSFGQTIGIDLPGLTNSGATLSLFSATETIHQISYTDDSYHNIDKNDGGWTLEIINPQNPCLDDANWIASTSLQGGTPGTKNSVWDTNFGNDNINLLQAFPNDPNSIIVSFDQLLGGNATKIIYYSLSPAIDISSIQLQGNSVVLNLDTPLQEGITYTLTTYVGITNCIDQAPLATQSIKIGLAQTPEQGDIVINEILFNPVTGGSDYIELFNNSNKIIDISDLVLANLHKENAIRPILASGLLFPNSYVAISPKPFQVIDQYQTPDTAWIIKNTLPTLDDDQGNVTLLANGIIIDSVEYNEEMHNHFISNKNGVALERINAAGNSQEPSNWISGASTTNYGTPGYKNAQASTVNHQGTDIVEVERKIFSPNGDGFEDYVLFSYSLPEGGYTLQARVYNAAGQYVSRLANNLLLAQKGQIRWDGFDFDQSPLMAGIYIIHFEFFLPDGEKIVARKTCALVTE